MLAHVAIQSQNIAGTVNFLVDTGADGTLLSPADADLLRINVARLPAGPTSIGVGGRVATVYAQARITVDAFSVEVALRNLAPTGRAQRQALAHIPSLLGRDILSHFALFFEERTGRVLLLAPHEANALLLPEPG